MSTISYITTKLKAQRGCPSSKLNYSPCHGIKLICALSCMQFNVSTEPLQLTHTNTHTQTNTDTDTQHIHTSHHTHTPHHTTPNTHTYTHHTQTHINTHKHIHIHTHKHICTYTYTHTHKTNLKGSIEQVLLCLANGRLFYISEDCTRRDRDRRALKSGLECNLAKLGLLLAKTGGRPADRPAALSLLLLLPVEAKLCDRSRTGIESASVSRSTDRPTHKAKPKDTSYHITAFRNNDHRLFCPASDTTQDNQRPSGLTSSSTGPLQLRQHCSTLRTDHNQNHNH